MRIENTAFFNSDDPQESESSSLMTNVVVSHSLDSVQKALASDGGSNAQLNVNSQSKKRCDHVAPVFSEPRKQF